MFLENPPLVWTTEDDNLLNDSVQLKESTYVGHVINERHRRELIGEEETIRGVVTSPNFITRDNNHDDRIHYLGLRFLKSQTSIMQWIDVCVDTSVSPADVCTIINQRKTPSHMTKENIIYADTGTFTF